MHQIPSNKALYVAPANPAGTLLKRQLTEAGLTIVGTIDNLKHDSGIINKPEHTIEDACIIVAHGLCQFEICAAFRKNGFKQDILLQQDQSLTFSPYRQSRRSILLNQCRRNIAYIGLRAFVKFAKILPGRKFLYVAHGFADTNVLSVYKAHHQIAPYETNSLLIDSDENYHSFESAGIPKRKALYRLLTARVLVIDHEFKHPIFDTVRNIIPTVQLWHGLPYKKISGNSHQAHVNDAAFISSSTWYNINIFNTLFASQSYKSLGYPRNDSLLLPPKSRPFSPRVNYSAWHFFQESCDGYIIYMPTYRDCATSDLPLPLTQLNKWLQSKNLRLILKIHPFVGAAIGETETREGHTLPNLTKLPHIHLFPSQEDIYPWLASADMLVTDYSSVATDFLLCDKPILYYQYDNDEYFKIRGEPLISEEYFVAGEIIKSKDELIAALDRNILDKSLYKADREGLKQKLGMRTSLALPAILKLIRSY